MTSVNFGPSAFGAAQTGAAIFDRSSEGRLRALDRDRIDLIHRMSTQDLTGMEAGEARRTVLTTAIGRMVDAPWVLHCGGTALLLTGPGRAGAVRQWLAQHVFYNDRVKFEDVSDGLAQLAIYGPQAGAVVNQLLPGAGELGENRFSDQDQVIVLRGHPFDGQGYTVIAPLERAGALQAALVAAGARSGDAAAYLAWRLARGEPEAGHEITEDYIPLEANLWGAVSFSKGCYIGQEIIARMESRGKLARRLMGLRLQAPVAEGTEVRAGSAVLGTVTSAGAAPGFGPLALAFLRTGTVEPGAQVTAGETGAIVSELPFGA